MLLTLNDLVIVSFGNVRIYQIMRVTQKILKMAASTFDWRDQLLNHPICQRLKDVIAKSGSHEVAGETKSLLAVKNGDLYVWDNGSACVLHCNLKSLLSVSDQSAEQRFQVTVKL